MDLAPNVNEHQNDTRGNTVNKHGDRLMAKLKSVFVLQLGNQHYLPYVADSKQNQHYNKSPFRCLRDPNQGFHILGCFFCEESTH